MSEIIGFPTLTQEYHEVVLKSYLYDFVLISSDFNKFHQDCIKAILHQDCQLGLYCDCTGINGSPPRGLRLDLEENCTLMRNFYLTCTVLWLSLTEIVL